MDLMRQRLSIITAPETDRRYREQVIEEIIAEHVKLQEEAQKGEEVVSLLEDSRYQRKRAKVLQGKVNYYEATLRVIAKETKISNARFMADKVVKRSRDLYRIP